MKFFILLSLFSFSATSFSSTTSYQELKEHKVVRLVEGRWIGSEKNIHFLTGAEEFVARDFSIGPNSDSTRLVFKSNISGDNYIGYFSSYDEDCLQYNEYGYVQHLCMTSSGSVAWSGPCSAGSYRTKMTLTSNGKLLKYGDHWNHEGILHRRNTAEFTRF